MSIFDQSIEEKISFRVRQIESVLGFVKTHISSGANEKAEKEAKNLEDEIFKLRELLKTN
jgi:hypothetical protein